MNQITVMAIVVIMASMWEISHADLNPEALDDRRGNIWLTKHQREMIARGCKIYVVGGSDKPSKSITIDSKCKCPTTVDKSNWLDGYKHGYKFSVTRNGDQATITRTDKKEGWGIMNLQFRCCPEDGNTCPKQGYRPSCKDNCVADLTAKGVDDCLKTSACEHACNWGRCPNYT